ncbi:MAG TPA: DUF2188 domain-containing protein [Solirubrobacteraceae bacterium]|nr:DUF2188 domain-containing protein [Solirubrobacteraceae bacterium]
MPDVTVHRHGDRWAVAEASGPSPLQEFPTREAAESAARRLAAGGRVEVVDDDPTGLAEGVEGAGAEPDAARRPPADGLHDHERLRSDQAGL